MIEQKKDDATRRQHAKAVARQNVSFAVTNKCTSPLLVTARDEKI